MWNAHANNCELRWNPATGRVEVYALLDILLNEELGTDYGAPSRPITDSPLGNKPKRSCPLQSLHSPLVCLKQQHPRSPDHSRLEVPTSRTIQTICPHGPASLPGA
jgi:hypothetical protein